MEYFLPSQPADDRHVGNGCVASCVVAVVWHDGRQHAAVSRPVSLRLSFYDTDFYETESSRQSTGHDRLDTTRS